MSLAELQSLVTDLVRDKDQIITTAQRDTAVQTAVLRYSSDRPLGLVEDVASAGGRRLPLPSAFVLGFSVVQQIEYPIGNVPATVLDLADVGLYRSPSSAEIDVGSSIAAGDLARVRYSGRHTVDALSDTLPEEHRLAVAAWAAAALCDQLANYYASEGESSIGADAVDHRNKSDVFASRARAYRAQYLKDIGADEKRIQAASAVVNLNSTSSSGLARLFARR